MHGRPLLPEKRLYSSAVLPGGREGGREGSFMYRKITTCRFSDSGAQRLMSARHVSGEDKSVFTEGGLQADKM